MPLYNQYYDYILLYVPKAACSLLRKIYVCIHEGEFTKEQKDILQTRSHHAIGSIHNGNKLPQEKIYSTKKLIVCRSPYTRVLSSYYDKFINISQRKNDKAHTFYNLLQFYSQVQCIDKLRLTVDIINNTNKNACVSLKEMYDLNHLKFQDTWSNDSFLSYLQFLDTCIQNNIVCYDEHHKPQTFINKNNINKTKLFENTEIFKIEDGIKDNIERVLETYICKNHLQKKKNSINDILNSKDTNSTPPKSYFNSIDCSNYTHSQINELYKTTGFLPDIKNMLCNKNVILLINKIYADDFIHLKYSII